jgi:hypothetical protein
MSNKSRLSFVTRTLTIAAPLALFVAAAGAAPVESLSAVCSPGSGQSAGAQSCSSVSAQATVTPNINFFGNGFTISLDEQGFATSMNGMPAGFTMSANVPVGFTIAGPDRAVVIKTVFSEQIENLSYSDGAVGEIDYGSNQFGANSKILDGGVGAQNLSFTYLGDPTTVSAMSGDDFASTYGLDYATQLNASISSGSIAAFLDLTDTVQIFEADGVTPVSLVASTPEPSSALLIIPGLLAFYLVHKKRQSRSV